MKALAACLLLGLATPAVAHEFWIDPAAHVLDPGDRIVADIRVGELFEGAAYSYVPPNFRRFDIALGDDVLPVPGRAGDRPALDMAAPGTGLAVVLHVTRDYRLTYDSWEKFVAFVTEKDASWVLDRHAARGLSRDGVRERYIRYAKALIGLGDAAGQDRAFGLRTEIVALTNPYDGDLSGGMPVQVLHQDQPRANARVTLFARAPDGAVTVTTHRTDAQGRVTLPVLPGHRYLVDSVVLRELAPDSPDAPVWESLWASLTFAVPQ